MAKERRRRFFVRCAGILRGKGWPAYFCKGGLGIEGVHVRWPAVQEEMNDAFGAGGKCGGCGASGLFAPVTASAARSLREAQRAHAHAAARQKLAAIERGKGMAEFILARTLINERKFVRQQKGLRILRPRFQQVQCWRRRAGEVLFRIPFQLAGRDHWRPKELIAVESLRGYRR